VKRLAVLLLVVAAGAAFVVFGGNDDDAALAPAAAPDWVAANEASLLDLLDEFYTRRTIAYDADFVRDRVRELARTARPKILETAEDEPTRAMALGVVLFCGDDALGSEPGLFRPDIALQKARGNCLGLATIYLLVAEQLDIDAAAVLRPYPLHVVVEAGGRTFDPSARFRAVARSTRVTWSGVGNAMRYGVSLTSRQVLALHVASVACTELGGTDRVAPVRNRRQFDLFRLALSVDADVPSALTGLALEAVVSVSGDADAWLRRAIDINPLLPGALALRARIAANEERDDDARRFAERVQSITGKELDEFLGSAVPD